MRYRKPVGHVGHGFSRTGRVRVRQDLLHQVRAPRAEIRAKHRQLRRQVPLHRDLPGVRGRDAEIRVYGERVERGAGRREAVGQRERPGRAGRDVERGRQRRLLGEQRGDALIHVGAAVDAIARANHQRVERRAPRETHARLESPPVGPHERVGAPVGRDEGHRGEVRRHVQVCETPASFGERRFEFPPDAVGQRDSGTRRPVVSHIRRIELPAEVLVRVAERDRARLRQPEQEVGEIESGGRAGEAERAAGILLSGDVVQDSPRLDPEPDVVRAAEAREIRPPHVRLGRRRGVSARAQAGHIAGKAQRRRPPVARVLVVAVDAREAGDVQAVGEERHQLAGRARVLIAQSQRHVPRGPQRQQAIRRQTGRGARVLEAKQRPRITGTALVRHAALNPVVASERVPSARVCRVLPRGVDDWCLVVDSPGGHILLPGRARAARTPAG